ncbi:hypothetical protein K469DRAFT_606843 [Zopfia rhizophila CBS 207.26]|uniref:Uncharacterized protein n=1 Tax=Zopfia rhizophila CBS 207.26 TaxID=1314779 RepID=A0A6A6DBY8_9PEZI|nr:hypothetical protein K469DRAFT_606843 [Zopfia rhizophila CBS 207.26]
MYFLTDISALFYASSFTVGGIAAAAPLCSETVDTAGGGPPNSVMPTAISAGAIKELQLAHFLENMEASFFNAGLTNITEWGTTGLPNDTIEVISKIAAQEEVHLSSIENVLKFHNETLIPPCNYSFPVNKTEEFFELAHTITSVGIGATIGLNERLAITDPLLAKSISSILTVESRHDAFFRHVRGAAPNPAPFDTGISDIWAYNLALSFIQPGSCSVELPIPILSRLTVSQPPSTSDTNSTGSNDQREFTWDPMQTPFVTEAGKQLFIGWISQLNKPVYTPLNITTKGKGTANVPQGLNGVVFAVVTVQQPDDVNDLAPATLAGPVAMSLS